MNKLVLGFGLAVLTFTVYYFTTRKEDEASPFLTYGLGISSCLFISLVLYNVLQHFKKK